MKNDQVYIDHILGAIEKIEGFVAGISRSDFNQSTLIQDAIIRNFEIIGEATKKISKSFTQSHPEIPWSSMAGMRDKLIHDYLDVDLDVVWKSVEIDIPLLKDLISEL
ncbi:MAG TPA: DUF86 domain-containing protein [Bacteroidales bacterium]|nr:DUF86 domain-containing protein [Bacteroidales bacterium]HRZ48158.1 DUF86 domain-containing protein [Bacteroidales bacterium]